MHVGGGYLDSKAVNDGDFTLVIYQESAPELGNKKLELEFFFDDACSGNRF